MRVRACVFACVRVQFMAKDHIKYRHFDKMKTSIAIGRSFCIKNRCFLTNELEYETKENTIEKDAIVFTERIYRRTKMLLVNLALYKVLESNSESRENKTPYSQVAFRMLLFLFSDIENGIEKSKYIAGDAYCSECLNKIANFHATKRQKKKKKKKRIARK